MIRFIFRQKFLFFERWDYAGVWGAPAKIMIMSLTSERAHSFYSSEHLQIFNAWAKRLQADYSLRTLSNFISRR